MKPKIFSARGGLVFALTLLLSINSFAQELLPPSPYSTAPATEGQLPSPASYADFDLRARAGEKLTIIFFGGALTWGDGASDPERTSFRALLKDYLKEKYPSAKFNFRDAAIGATGSKLGMFRIGRDVLHHKPDLVFLDFTTEDKLYGTDRETLASYELILRDLIDNGIPVVQIVLGTKDYFGQAWTHLGPQRMRDHLEMGTLYHTAVGNSFPVIQNYLRSELHHLDEIWLPGEADPNDVGHRLIYEATRNGLEQAIREKRICNLPPEPVFADEYKNRFHFFPSTFPIPAGWRIAKTLRPNLEAVVMANGWKNEVVISEINERENVKPLKLNFNGTFLGILGEADEHGLGFKVWVDGKILPYQEIPRDEVWPTSTIPYGGGERFFWHEVSDQLKPGRHRVEILPVFSRDPKIPTRTLQLELGDSSSPKTPNVAPATKGALRIESICVAGPDPEVAQRLSIGQ